MNAAAPRTEETKLVLPATKAQPLKLQVFRDSDRLRCAAYTRSNPHVHVVFACADPERCRINDPEYTGDKHSLWIGGAAFDIDAKYVDQVRAFLGATP